MGGGALLFLVPRREYNFSGLANSGSISFPIVRNVPIEAWMSGVLLVRQHSATIVGGATVTVTALNSFPSAEDPDRDFTSLLGTVSLGGSSPTLKSAALALGASGALTVLLGGTRPLSGGGNIVVVISLELAARASA